MKRREFVGKLGAGSAALVSLPAVASGQGHAHTPLSGPLANATVSFGGVATGRPAIGQVSQQFAGESKRPPVGAA